LAAVAILGLLLLVPSIYAASPSVTTSKTTTTITTTTAAPTRGILAAGVPSAIGGWWDDKYGYRVNISLTNPSTQALVQRPFFIRLTFPSSHLFDAAAELRLVDNSGQEVPSYVLDEVTSGGFVSSAWLLVLGNLPASSVRSFHLYYGNPSAAVPAYRSATPIGNITQGRLTVNLRGSEPGSSSFQLVYGDTYSQSFLSKVSYSSGK
jgi:hypothetical protein